MHDEFGIVPDPIFDKDGTVTIEVPDEICLEEARFNRTNLSKKDFREARDYLSEFARITSLLVRRAIVIAAIVAYSRPFKNSNGGATGRATRKLEVDLGKFLEPDELALHGRLIELRDQAVAHSDYDFRPTIRVEGMVAANSTGFATWTLAFDVLELEPQLERFTVLTEKLERYCSDELFRLNQELSTNKQPRTKP